MTSTRKRVDVVKVKLCKESSFLYEPRKLTSPNDAVRLIKSILDDTDREMFLAIALNTKNEPIAVTVVSIGTINSSIVHPREVFKFAILSNSASILLAHNHPSGNPLPSNEDSLITKRLTDAGKLIGIKVLDHIIVGDQKHYSFKEDSNEFD